MSGEFRLSPRAAQAVKVMQAGGWIEVRRVYPCPHHYWLTKADGTRLASQLPLVAVQELVHHRLVHVTESDRRFLDSFNYRITPAGVRAANRNGVVEFDDPQQYESSPLLASMMAAVTP